MRRMKTRLPINVNVPSMIHSSLVSSSCTLLKTDGPSSIIAKGRTQAAVVGEVYRVAVNGDICCSAFSPDAPGFPLSRTWVIAHLSPPSAVAISCKIKPCKMNECPSPTEASAIPEAIVTSDKQRFVEKLSIPNKSPHIIVKIGEPPLRIVPKDTVRIFKAMFEHPISRAVVIPMGSTYSLNLFRVNCSGFHARRRDNRKAQIDVSVFENVVTVSGYEKRLLNSHFDVRMMLVDKMYQNSNVRLVLRVARKRE